MRFRLALLMLPLVPLVQAQAAAPAKAASAETQDAALLAFLDQAYDARLDLSPESQTQLGLKRHYDRLDDYTDAAAIRAQALAERQLTEMQGRFRQARPGDQLHGRAVEDHRTARAGRA